MRRPGPPIYEKDPLAVLVMFFGLLFVGLFLGDGLQTVVDVYGVTIVAVLWGVFLMKRFPRYSLPRPVRYIWTTVVALAAVSTVFSGSIGLSVSWWIRLTAGYFLYRLFYSFATPRRAKQFVYGAATFAACAGGISLLFRAAPSLQSILPSMNLLNVTYGHNHLADLLVFVAPAVVYLTRKYKTKYKIALLALFGVFLFTTYARGAWLLVGLYFGIESVFRRSKKYGILALVVLLCTATALYGGKNVREPGPLAPELSRVVRPQSITARVGYWKQAVYGFLEHPVAGSGPGTFSLVSREFSAGPNSVSWFAHSLPLQTAAEMGALGMVAFVLWYGYHAVLFATGWKRASPAARTLFIGIMMVFVYALFEFILDYLVIWFLFWSALGLCTGAIYEKREKQRTNTGLIAGGVLGGLFYLSWVMSSIVGIVFHNYRLAFMLAPFDTTQAGVYLETSSYAPVDPSTEMMIRVFHRRNASLLAMYARRAIRSGDAAVAIDAYQKALRYNPQNYSVAATYMEYLSHTQDDHALVTEIIRLCRIQSAAECLLPALSDPGFLKALRMRVETTPTSGQGTYREHIQKALYFAGLDTLPRSPEVTRDAWTLAGRLDPDWGYYSVELASLYYSVFHDDEAAGNVLIRCAQNRYAKPGCEPYIGHHGSLPRAGSQKQNIESIPVIPSTQQTQ